MFNRVAILAIIASFLSFNLPANSQNCIPIPVVGGEGNEVTKSIAQPTIPGPFGISITRNNWNTDWAVPGGQSFKYFLVTLTTERGGRFNVRMNLKYSDNTADEFFNERGLRLNAGEVLREQGVPRPNDMPFQVNVYVGGIDNIGSRYTVSAVGCR
ncbi:conserved hypothetical protein [Gloeothece citriformis PCC 7424]|uniref:Sll0756 protein n=1 Tax=Gloeothece citriformis (strain PCC 7424) TaxID=65393 RepID=B7KKN4_GLOC7|nr:hypothetical protein [Gloeothece citriformis]ACK71003.1 conserved hypothetical protein [Gloeothece citriformis PCC 7424]